MSMHTGLPVVTLLGLAFLAATRAASADPAVEESLKCEVASAQQAATLADRLYQRAEYQRAGKCYQAAGDLAHANLAFLKAAGPQGADTARDLKSQRDAARQLLSSVAQAFRGNH
jgi:hypothetical protein